MQAYWIFASVDIVADVMRGCRIRELCPRAKDWLDGFCSSSSDFGRSKFGVNVRLSRHVF